MEHQHVMYTLEPAMSPTEASPRPADGRTSPIRPGSISGLPLGGARALRTRLGR